MKRVRTKANNPLKCEFCKIFNESENRKILQSSGRVVVHERMCKIKGEMIKPENEACMEFILNNYLVCKDGVRLNVFACLGRQKRGVEDCENCKIGSGVLFNISQNKVLA